MVKKRLHHYKKLIQILSSAHCIHTHLNTIIEGQHLHIITMPKLYNVLDCSNFPVLDSMVEKKLSTHASYAPAGATEVACKININQD